LPLPEAANLLLCCAEGRVAQFVRSEFKRPPTAGWAEQFAFLMDGFFRDVPSVATATSAPVA
jgi:TetR/AcrR family transcriptional regulator